MGDWGSGKPQQREVAEAMARYAAKTPPAFVVLTGDNFYEKGISGVDDPQWQQKFEQVYDAKRLPMPFIAVLGNHDWGLNPLDQILYAQRTTGTRWQMDGFYFRRSYGQLADFFFIDTDLYNYQLETLAQKQTAWLEDGLRNSTARWQIVVGHHPLYSDGEHGRDKEILALRDKLGPIFTRWGVDAYLCGHDHDLQSSHVAGVPTLFVVSGAGGKLRPRSFNDYGPFFSVGGFAAITLTNDRLRGEFLDSDLKTLDSWQHSPAPPALP